jgi:hypothetical protein
LAGDTRRILIDLFFPAKIGVGAPKRSCSFIQPGGQIRGLLVHHDIAAGNGCRRVVGEAVGSVELDQDRILTRACGTTVGRTHFERVTWFSVHSAFSIEDQEISADIDFGDGCARKLQRLGPIATVEGEIVETAGGKCSWPDGSNAEAGR